MSWAWAAGLFEGDGSITLRYYERATMRRLTMSMCDFDVVRKFADVVDCGQVHERKARRESWSDQLQWICTDSKEAAEWAKEIRHNKMPFSEV